MLVVDRSIVPPRPKLYLIEGKLVLGEQLGEFIVCRFREKEKVEVCGVVTAIVLKL